MRQVNNPVDISHVCFIHNLAYRPEFRIFEAAGINLINDDFFPPFGVGDGCLKFRLGWATQLDGNNQ